MKIRNMANDTLGWLVNLPLKVANAKTRYVRVPSDSFERDGLVTSHNSRFLMEPRFIKAYERAKIACGRDYDIPWRTHVLLWAGKNVAPLGLEGAAYVELGTGKGWMFSALLNYLDWQAMGCNAWLFDSFESSRIDPVTGVSDSTLGSHPCYAESFESTKENFAEWERVHLIKGRLPEALASFTDSSIAFLHVDLNHPAAEVESVRRLWPLMKAGSIMVLDDYGFRSHEMQYEAMNKLAVELDFEIMSLPSGQGLAVKR